MLLHNGEDSNSFFIFAKKSWDHNLIYFATDIAHLQKQMTESGTKLF